MLLGLNSNILWKDNDEMIHENTGVICFCLGPIVTLAASIQNGSYLVCCTVQLTCKRHVDYYRDSNNKNGLA
jgi:hypothetical protein